MTQSEPEFLIQNENLPRGLSRSQAERIFFIDFKAEFTGRVARADISARFSVKQAAGTRDLSLYRSLRPDNLALESRTKAWLRTSRFKPLFTHRSEAVLTALAEGWGDDVISTARPASEVVRPLRLNTPDIGILAQATRAIFARQTLSIRYLSLSSGESQRAITPHALADSGLRWHLRAWDHHRDRFGDFVLTRIKAASVLGATPPPEAASEHDVDWQQMVEIELRPHPQLVHPEAIEHDYGMTMGQLVLRQRAAMVSYALQFWNVDASFGHDLDPARHQLWLANAQKLDSMGLLDIAPR